MKEKSFRKQNFVISSVIGLLLSLPVTGFIYGFFACKDCGDGFSGFLGRIFIGIVEIFLTIFTLGKPWDNEGGTSSTNLRLYVLLTALVISILVYFIRSRLNKRKVRRILQQNASNTH